MQRHEDVVLNQIGTPIPGVTVTVRVQNATPGSGALATIYSDDGTTIISGSAVTTNTFGRFFFFAPDGKYDLTATGSGITTYTLADIEIADVTERFSSDSGWTVDTQTVGIWNNIRVVDGAKFTTIQAAHDDLPSTGGYIFVPSGDRTFSSDLTLSKPVAIIADIGVWTLGTNRILIRSDNVTLIGPTPGLINLSTGQLVFDYDGTSSAVDMGDGTTDTDGLLLENFRIQANSGTAQTSGTARGLKTTSVSHSVFRNLVVQNFQSGIAWEATTTASAGGSILNEVYNFNTAQVDNGFVVTATAEPNTVKAWKFYGGTIWGGAAAGSIGFDFASSAATQGGEHALFGVECASFDIPYRINQPSVSLHGTRSETVTTAHIQIQSNANRTQLYAHKFIGAGTQVSDAGTNTSRWDVDAPISVNNSSDGGDGSLIFENDASIVMEEAGGTARVVAEMTSSDVFNLGNVNNQTALNGSAIRVEADFNPLSAGGFKQSFGFFQDNVAASQSAVSLSDGMSTRGYSVPRAGSVLGVVVTSNEARTAGTLTITVFIGGTNTGFTAVLDGTNTTTKATLQAKDLDTFVAGDLIRTVITTDASWAPTTADINVTVEVEY